MSLQKEYEAYLSHYGVPGMKWGVRKEVYNSFNKEQKKALRDYGKSWYKYNVMQNKKLARLMRGKDIKYTKKEDTLIDKTERLEKAMKKATKLKLKDIDQTQIDEQMLKRRQRTVKSLIYGIGIPLSIAADLYLNKDRYF